MPVKVYQIPPPDHQGAISLGSGVTIEWLRGGRVFHLKTSNATRSAIDIWRDVTIQVAHQSSENTPVLFLFEIEALPFTPYMRRSAEMILKANRDRKGKTAILLRPSIFTSIIRFFVERESYRLNANFVRRIFTAKEEALNWLLEPPEPPPLMDKPK